VQSACDYYARTGSCRQFERARNLLSVAFSASLTRTPPMPRNPPSLDASATCWLIWRNQPLKAAASPSALASTTAPACRSVSIHLALISEGLLPVNFCLRPSRAVLRPSVVSKSATTALISASVPGSNLAAISALPSAKLSFRRPHRPLGSAAETAIPAIITLSRRSFHSSGVKVDLSGMGLLLYLSLGLRDCGYCRINHSHRASSVMIAAGRCCFYCGPRPSVVSGCCFCCGPRRSMAASCCLLQLSARGGLQVFLLLCLTALSSFLLLLRSAALGSRPLLLAR